MSLKKAGEGLKGVEKTLEFMGEIGQETGESKTNAFEYVSEAVTTLGDLVIGLGEASIWDFINNLLEAIEDSLRILAKIAGPALGPMFKLLSKLVTAYAKQGEATG